MLDFECEYVTFSFVVSRPSELNQTVQSMHLNKIYNNHQILIILTNIKQENLMNGVKVTICMTLRILIIYPSFYRHAWGSLVKHRLPGQASPVD